MTKQILELYIICKIFAFQVVNLLIDIWKICVYLLEGLYNGVKDLLECFMYFNGIDHLPKPVWNCPVLSTYINPSISIDDTPQSFLSWNIISKCVVD